MSEPEPAAPSPDTSPARGGNHFLTVDEGVRPRANSDPTAGCALPVVLLPEITVEDCTLDAELMDIHGAGGPGGLQDQGGLFGLDATPRRRAHTCPEDLFRRPRAGVGGGRPPTPPPSTFRHNRRKGSGSFRFLSGKSPLKESVSFTHHRLTKLAESEDAADESQSPSASSGGEQGAKSLDSLARQLNTVELGSSDAKDTEVRECGQGRVQVHQRPLHHAGASRGDRGQW